MSAESVVIVGASIAGVSAAVAMRDHGFEGSISLVDSEDREPYERPPLSKTGDPQRAVRPILPNDTYAAKRIDLVLGATVDSIDIDRRKVHLDNGNALPADQVLLATGVSARRLGVPGEDLENVLTLRTADDAAKVFAALASGGPLVVIGGGFIGLEAAAVARGLGLEVTVVEYESLPLLRPLGQSTAELMLQLHHSQGVRVIPSQSAASFRGTNTVEEVVLSSGERLPAATVIVGCGVTPNDSLAEAAGVYCNDGIVVDSTGRTSNPLIWAAGDVANQLHPHLGRRARIEHWDVAMRHGGAIGATMAGHSTENTELPYFWSDQYGATLQMYGRARPGDRVIIREGATPDRFLAFWLRDGHLGAVAGLGEAKSVRAVKSLVELRAAIDPLLLADPATDLRQLARTAIQPAGASR